MAIKTSAEIILRTCECNRCRHLWPTKLQGREPLICPRCRSMYWNTKLAHVPKHELARVKELLAKLKQKESAA